MFNREFAVDALERAVKTFAQALLAVLAVGTPLWEIPWTEGLGIAATATVISVLTSIASAGLGSPGSASAAYIGQHRKVE